MGDGREGGGNVWEFAALSNFFWAEKRFDCRASLRVVAMKRVEGLKGFDKRRVAGKVYVSV